eukprot:TRINITY_DN66040_c7_g3_i1.p1 TRINITY_DN66040_c7_g3~~TRINITY_DN66040_c7_g3_i1.p1  ORF type:complete len:2447 (+),score=1447.66 TRINITY_DN66040_c7_g3_i1:190-7530(+)
MSQLEVELPPGAIIGDDGMVYNERGEVIGSLELQQDDKNLPRSSSASIVPGAPLADDVQVDWQGVELPPGCTVDDQGRVFDADGQLVGVLEEQGGAQPGGGAPGDDDDEKKQKMPPASPSASSQPGAGRGSGKAEEQLTVEVLDGALFGLEPGMFVGKATGKVYDSDGNEVGFLKGYVAPDESGLAKPKPPPGPPPSRDEEKKQAVSVAAEAKDDDAAEEEPLEVVDGQNLGLPAGHFVAKDGRVFDGDGNLLGMLEGYAESQGVKPAKIPQPTVAAVDEALQLTDEMLAEAEFQDGKVMWQGKLVGHVIEDGSIVALDGITRLGRVADESRKTVKKQSEAERKLSEQEVLRQMFHVPEYNHSVKQGKHATLADEVKEESWQPIEVVEDVEQIAEPVAGLQPLGSVVKQLDKARRSMKVYEVVPSRFSRPFLAPDFEHEQKVMDQHRLIAALEKRLDVTKLRLVWIHNVDRFLTKVQLKSIHKYLNRMVNLQVLGVLASNLSKLDIKLPHLLRLDVQDNNFRSYKSIQSMIKHSPDLQTLDVRFNPLSSSWSNPLPPLKDNMWKVILGHMHLSSFNGVLVPNYARLQALDRFGNKDLRKRVPMALFHFAMNRQPVVYKMQQWNPAALQQLNLKGQALSHLYVGTLVNLVLLDASQNNIQTLQDSGLQQCQKLEQLNLDDNKLSSLKALQVLMHCSMLRSLRLHGNSKLPKDYRLGVLFITRHLRGNNRAQGLLELDGHPVKLEERVQAIIEYGSKKQENLWRWRLNLIATYGHVQMRSIENFLQRVKVLTMPERNLGWVDISQFKRLEVLDLSSNRLIHVDGLQHMRHLRVLNLSNNPSLDEKHVLSALNKSPPIETLEQVFLAKDRRKINNANVRKILIALAKTNRKLAVVDGIIPSVEDRVHTFKKVFTGKDRAVAAYRFGLGVVMSATPFEGRSYHPEDLALQGARAQIKADEVTTLLKMANLKLVSSCVQLDSFKQLRKLNLADNNLSNISEIGLNGLPELAFLDVRNNNIKTKPVELGRIIDSLKKLQVLAIRGNPCMRNKKDRLRLMGSIPGLREVNCTLMVIDQPIDIHERVEAWKLQGGSDEEAEKLRYETALFLRAPRPEKIPDADVLRLNLDRMGLQRVNLLRYANLEVLRLRGNKLTELRGIGLEKMSRLRVLDVRDNALTDLEYLVSIIERLRHLEYVGASGNKYSRSKEYVKFRQRVIGGVRKLHKIGCPLVYLDDQKITVDEIVDAWTASGGDYEQVQMFRFDLAVHRRLPPGQKPQKMVEFDLSGAKLTVVDLAPFRHVRRLNLAHNLLTWSKLKKPGMINRLKECEELSLSDNKLKEARKVASLPHTLPRLERLWVDKNKCCPDNSRQSRVRFLSFVHGVEEPELVLQFLNGEPITVPERVDAFITRLKEADDEDHSNEEIEEEAERVRLVLALESVGAAYDARKLDLSRQSLKTVVKLSSYTELRELNLSHNLLTTLTHNAHHCVLGELKHLRSLDLSHNKFPSLSVLVQEELSQIASLRYLSIKHATVDGLTSKERREEGALIVQKQLLGLIELDGVELKPSLNKLQKDAHFFLWKLAGVGINQLIDVDISGLRIPGEYFYYVLAALKEIQRTKTLMMNDNGWNRGRRAVDNYRNYCIYALQPGLERLDGERVVDDEVLRAMQTVSQDNQKSAEFGRKLVPWKECRKKAFLKIDQHADELPYGGLEADKKAKKKLFHGPDFVDIPIAGAGAGAGAQLGAADDKKAVGANRGPGSGNANGDDGANGDAPVAQANRQENDDGGAGDDRKEQLREQAEVALERAETVLADGAAEIERELGNVFVGVKGAFINKMEILINFLQIYGLILILDVDIDWPSAFLDFSVWVRFFSVDIEVLFDINVPYQQELKFGVFMALPLIFLLFYFSLGRVNKHKKQWEDAYITRWEKVHGKNRLIWLVCVALTIVLGFAYDHPTSFRLVKDDKTWPSGRTNGFIVIGFSIFTGLYLIWYMVVSTFRKHRLKDRSALSAEFTEWWLGRLAGMRRICLFMLTVLYLPVSRVILSQFQCICPDPIDGVEQPCHLYNHKPDKCPSLDTSGVPDFSVLQWLAIGFGLTYVIALPIFFTLLIRRGVHQMIGIHGFDDERERVQKARAALKMRLKKHKGDLSKAEQKEIKKQLKKLKEGLNDYYYAKAVANTAPQSYLYLSYSYPNRFHKISQMFQKLLIVVITMFVSRQFYSQTKLLLGFIVVGAFAVFQIFARAFNDALENVMDIVSQSANAISILIALCIQDDRINLASSTASAVLLLVNGAALSLFSLGILASPLLYCKETVMRNAYEAKQKALRLARAHNLSSDDLADAKAAAAAGAKGVGKHAGKHAEHAGKHAADGARHAGKHAKHAGKHAADGARHAAKHAKHAAEHAADGARHAAKHAADGAQQAVDAARPHAEKAAQEAARLAGDAGRHAREAARQHQ